MAADTNGHGSNGKGLSKDLASILVRGGSQDEFDRQIFYHDLEKKRETDPELAEMVRACAIPTFFDTEVIGVLRNKPDEKTRNQFILDELLPLSFILERKEGGYYYRHAARDLILKDWELERHRDSYHKYRLRLIAFFQQRGQKLYSDRKSVV